MVEYQLKGGISELMTHIRRIREAQALEPDPYSRAVKL